MGTTHVEHLNFAFDSSELTDEASERLEKVIAGLKKVGGKTLINVYAYTDSLGSDAYNQRLSQRRADQIKSILMDSGFSEDSIKAVGRGERDPIADNGTEEGRAQNRRVEFLVEQVTESK